jgi:hypothetical protein
LQTLTVRAPGSFCGTLEVRQDLKLRLLGDTFAIAKLDSAVDLGAWAHAGELVQIVRTPNELSIVCRDEAVPAGVTVERGWRCFASADALDVNQAGILASISAPLAAAGISIFVISTFDNDYVLVRVHDLERAVGVLERNGFVFTAP